MDMDRMQELDIVARKMMMEFLTKFAEGLSEDRNSSSYWIDLGDEGIWDFQAKRRE